jgi:Flp pilus assembly protein TadD
MSRSIELDPTLSIVHSTRGALLVRDRKYDEAMSDLNLALKLNPKNFHVYEN